MTINCQDEEEDSDSNVRAVYVGILATLLCVCTIFNSSLLMFGVCLFSKGLVR